MKRITHVYLAGPISKGDQFVNVRTAIIEARRLRHAGYVVYVPHRCALDQMIAPEGYEAWMADDLAWIDRVDAVVRIPGESPGSDREVEHARRRGIPVFFGVESLIAEAPHVAVEALG